MAETADTFIGDLRRLVARWRGDAIHLDSQGSPELARHIETWIAEIERLIASHERTHA
jgi:hypothetical protein